LIRLVHWNFDEAKERADRILGLGYKVDYSPFTVQSIQELNKHPPEAIVIDLSRLPSQGRDVAANLGQYESLRIVPIIFVGGNPEKVIRIQGIFPDLTYGDWPNIAALLKKAISTAGTAKRVSTSAFEAYKHVPLAKKLSINKDQTTRLVNAPADFELSLGTLPRGAVLTRRTVRGPDITIWFVKSQAELAKKIREKVKAAGQGRLWIAWPKKTSTIATDLTQTVVRETGLSNGLVDYKICAMNNTWSGLLFTERQSRDTIRKDKTRDKIVNTRS
jgi:hypothetical protein